ncbi:hypothetical protein F3Y22_tig00002793pilonHSYRG00314 [Hibiscus syriacus]|uniref:Uncharacterized protein n=1 Tax=Hibiscus syriacus TaxID=106335 RepID=A0A6A3CQ91_HIBSY|nr:hypothetical protein F3Y22_tig00002793pilonHSYRG00314 [Hibiscus syriacus]
MEKGALFIEAETKYVVDDLVGNTMNYSPDFWRLVPKVDYSADVSSYPLILTQVWRSWSLDRSTAYFSRWSLLQARVPLTPTFHHAEHDPPLSMNTAEEPQWEPETTVSIKLIRDQLNTLKDKANRNRDGGVYSTYNSLSAHIWRCINIARCLPDDQTTKLHIPIDGRSRLRPSLSPGYLGNAIFMSATIALHAIDYMEKVPNVKAPVREAWGFQCPNLSINSWMWLPLYDADFDYMEKVPNVKAPVREAWGFQCPNLSINSWMWLPLYDADFG